MKNVVCFVRHGQTNVNNLKKIQDNLDLQTEHKKFQRNH